MGPARKLGKIQYFKPTSKTVYCMIVVLDLRSSASWAHELIFKTTPHGKNLSTDRTPFGLSRGVGTHWRVLEPPQLDAVAMESRTQPLLSEHWDASVLGRHQLQGAAWSLVWSLSQCPYWQMLLGRAM